MEHQPIIGAARQRRTALWVALGIAMGLVLAPAAAVAAGVTLTSIVGATGAKAVVTKAGQLETIPSELAYVRQYGPLALSSTCQRLVTPPKGFSLVLTQVSLSVTSVTTPGPNAEAAFGIASSTSAGTNCSAVTPIGQVAPAANGETTLPFNPGFVVPAGKSIWAAGYNITVYAFAMGYLVPSADAPTATPVTAVSHSGP